MNRYTSLIAISIACAVMSMVYASTANAARLYMAPSALQAGTQCKAQVRISTDPQEQINAIEGTIIIPQFIIAEDLRYGNSVITLWLDTPVISNGRIVFSGITPGGFSGDGELLEFACLNSGDGRGQILLSGVKVYLNDGRGSLASTTTANATINSVATTSTLQLLSNDRKPPEEFQPQIVSDPALFDGDKTLIFSAQDKESGISHYETLENGRWVNIQSPYRIPDQSLKTPLYIRAVDNSGNFIVVVVASGTGVVVDLEKQQQNKDANQFGGLHLLLWGVILLVVCILAGGAYYWLRRR